jgi:leader peptidase (prepilin peptidase) / N-methyltransferase
MFAASASPEIVLLWSYSSVMVLLFLFGACLASFLLLVAERIPLGLSIVSPPSMCLECKTPLPAYALIPILGWFLVRGQCRSCGAKVSPLHPILETFVGLGTLFVVLHFCTFDEILAWFGVSLPNSPALGTTPWQNFFPMVTALWFFYTAIPLIITDLRHRILPNSITLPGLVVALFLGSMNPYLGWKNAFLGAFVGGVSLWLVAIFYKYVRQREGLGYGDVKYLAMIGACVGWQKVFLCLGVASFLGLIGAIFLLATTPKTRQLGLKLAIPFGPFLALGTLLVLLYGDSILQLVLSFTRGV